MGTPLVLVAASGLAREVLSSLEQQDRYEVVGILDDSPALSGTSMHRVPVLGPISAAVDHPAAHLVVCAGKGSQRSDIVERLLALRIEEKRFATIVDQSVQVPSSCSIGTGSIVLAGTVLTVDVVVGRHVVIMPNVTLTHDNVVDDFATLCAGVTLGGTVTVGRAAYLGMNSCARENLAIGPGAVLGMGAALTHDLPADQTWIGAPARPLQRPGARPPAPSDVEPEGRPTW